MPKHAFVANGRIIIDEWRERFFLFVSASTHLTLEGKTILGDAFPETDREILEDSFPDNSRIPVGFSADPAAFSGFRIFRLFMANDELVPEDVREGHTSRAVTIAGHIATDAEMRSHGSLTNPSITLDKLVTFEAIQQRAFNTFRLGKGSGALNDWLEAETELLAN